MESLDRRGALAVLAAAAAAPIVAWEPAAAAIPAPTMWRDPGCGCCGGWSRKVEAALGTKFKVVDSPNMAAVKSARGVPVDLRSCHTALIGGYVVEGHVPAEDIKRLLATRPAGAIGIATPGMPAGSPGMEMGATREPYRVFAFDRSGRRSVFASHG